MSPKRKYLYKSIITASFVMMLFAACHSKSPNAQLLEFEGKYPDESAENITITVSDLSSLERLLEGFTGAVTSTS